MLKGEGREGGGGGGGKNGPSSKKTSFDNNTLPTPTPGICHKQISHWKKKLSKKAFGTNIGPGQCRNFKVCCNHFYMSMPFQTHNIFRVLCGIREGILPRLRNHPSLGGER